MNPIPTAASPASHVNVVFDFGAVLFTWQPHTLVQQHLGAHAPDVQSAHDLGRAIFGHEDWHRFDGGLLDLHEVAGRTAQRLGLPLDGLHQLLDPIGERLSPIAESVALLDSLRERREQQGDVRLYYLSNMPEPFARVLEQRHDFLGWFDGGVFSGDVQLCKPDPRIYTKLAERHQLDPARTLFIDDLPGNVEAAEALGWHGEHCATPDGLHQRVWTRLQSQFGL